MLKAKAYVVTFCVREVNKQNDRQIDRHLMFYTQSATKGQMRANLNVLLPQVKFSFTVSDIISLHVMIGEFWGKMKLNESGKQKPGRYKSAGAACKTIFLHTPGLVKRGNL